MNCNITIHGLMKNVYEFFIKGSKLKYGGYRIKTKTMYLI